MSQSRSTNTGTGAATADHYALLGLEERYRIDPKALESHYIERSKRIHPDRFVNAPASERVAALQRSMALNQAYKIVKDPIARAEYLLTKSGLVIGASEQLDPAFLMEVLDAREELAEAKAAGDRATLGRLEDEMLDRRDASLAEVARLFEAYFDDVRPTPEASPEASPEENSGPGSDDRLIAIKKHIIVLRYIVRYLGEFDDIDDEDQP